MAAISGYRVGAMHNEMFVQKDGIIRGIEPNLRPAGGEMWDLISLAYPNFNPWDLWLEVMVGKKINPWRSYGKQKYFVSMMFIRAPRDGKISRFPNALDIAISNPGNKYFRVVWTKQGGDKVTSIPKDNSDFIGYCVTRHKSYATLKSQISSIRKGVSEMVTID